MKRTTTLFATSIFALALAPALQAQGYPNQAPQGYPPQGQGYQAPQDRDHNGYPDAARMDRVARLAHDINETSTSIRRAAARTRHRPDPAEAQLLSDLFQLNRQAGHFEHEVQSYRRDPRHTADDFARLETAFNQVGSSLQALPPRPYIDRGMDRIYASMTDLSRFYGRHGYDRWGHHGHGDDHGDHDHGDRDRDHGDRGPEYRPPYGS
jgi:hypothetical protein